MSLNRQAVESAPTIYYSRLLKDRIIFLGEEVDRCGSECDHCTASVPGSQKIRTRTFSLYINSPGGSVTAGMAIYDTMQYIKCDVVHNLYRYGRKYGSISSCRR